MPTEIVVPAALGEPARARIGGEQLDIIRRTVARDCNEAEFAVFCEVVARYGFDPFARHIYAARVEGKDGKPPSSAIIVSRDGLLAVANRYSDFGGMDGDVIRGTDLIERGENGFRHTYTATPAKERLETPPVGAWAEVYRAERRPTFFLAPFAQYKRSNRTWARYPDAMILKVAQSLALRLAFSITGVVAEDEVGARYSDGEGGVIDSAAVSIEAEDEARWAANPDLALLRAAFDEANEIMPGSFLPQKIRLAMAGAEADDRRRQSLLADVTAFIDRHGGQPPSLP
jgi:phage recombination protein Bet